MVSKTTGEALKEKGYVLDKECDVPEKQAESLGETLNTPEVLTSWILSQYQREDRQEILQSIDTPEVNLPDELPYKKLVGNYHLKDQEDEVVKASCFCNADTVNTWYLHGANDSKAVKSSKAEESKHDKKKKVVLERWLQDPRKGPVPRDVFTKEFTANTTHVIALSYEHEHYGDGNTDMSDGLLLREARMSTDTRDKVVADQYEIDGVSKVKDLWHDGCLQPTGTGLYAHADAVGGILPYISPTATVVKVPCSMEAPNGTWLFPRTMKKEEMFISSMITLLGTRHQKLLVMPTPKDGKTFKWAGLDGFRPTVKLGGSDRFWLRVELMCGILRGNMVVGRKAAASVIWTVSWYRALLKGMRMGMKAKFLKSSSQDCDFGKTLCNGGNIHKPIGVCAAAIASMLHLDLKILYRKITYRLDVVWQQWRLALGISYVNPSETFNRALIAPLFDAEINDKDDVVEVTLFFMYIVHRLEKNPSVLKKDLRSRILLEEAYSFVQMGYKQPYGALEAILRPITRYELQCTIDEEPYDLKGVLHFKSSRTLNDQRHDQLPYAWKPITDGIGFAGILSASKMKPLLLKHCETQRLVYLKGLPSDSDAFQIVLGLNPEEELLKVFQECKRQLLPKDLWLSNEQGLVVVNAYATPTDEIKESMQPEANNEWLVLPERVQGKNIDEWEVYQLVFRVSTQSVDDGSAHLIAIRKCAPADATIPISMQNVRDARLAVVDQRLYGKVDFGVQEYLEKGTAFENAGAEDFIRLKQDGTIEKPESTGFDFPSSSLPSALPSSSSEDVPPIQRGLTEDGGNAYQLVVDRLWKFTWR